MNEPSLPGSAAVSAAVFTGGAAGTAA
ncbi:MAG: hypothetical protein JWO38_1866, partial [Gemmataceae bacterium]|nr:hypothetical protein [Gemmataceae bacterium]